MPEENKDQIQPDHLRAIRLIHQKQDAMRDELLALDWAEQAIRFHYHLQEGDQVNLLTGAIARGIQKEGVGEKT